MNSHPTMNYYPEVYPNTNGSVQQPQASMAQYYEQNKLPSIYVPYQVQQPMMGNNGEYFYSSMPAATQGAAPVSQQLAPQLPSQQPQMQRIISPGYYQPSIIPSQNLLHPYQYGTMSGVNGARSPQPKQHYPISPMSNNESLPGNSPSRPDTHSEEKNASIDYSSLVGYTISPSLKRRRRSKQRNIDTNQAFPCNECGKVFQKPYNLKSHMKTHSSEKPFKCSTCSKTFARSHDKKRHELLHAGEKNFKCEGFLKDGTTKWGCSKKFARSDALSRHFRTETGWLCIKPLMDEARDSEHSSVNTQQQQQDDTYMDSASFIRRFIQPK